MDGALSPPKVVLRAAHYTATGDIVRLASLAAQFGRVLRKELLLRLLLTYLPARIGTAAYLPFLQSLDAGEYSAFFPLAALDGADTADIDGLSEAQAAKRVRKLRLHPLLPGGGDGTNGRLSGAKPRRAAGGDDANERTAYGDEGVDSDAEDEGEDPLVIFLIQRAYAVDDGAGALAELPALLAPFVDRSTSLRSWAISTLLPLVRRNCDFYPDHAIPQTLAEFEHLPDRLAVARLLSQTGNRNGGGLPDDQATALVGRDLRGMIGPWLFSDRRWPKRRRRTTASSAGAAEGDAGVGGGGGELCPGWEEVLQWLTAQAATAAWPVAAAAIEQWDGPSDVDLGDFGGAVWLQEGEQEHLELRYARAALACAYLMASSASSSSSSSLASLGETALHGAYGVVSKIAGLLGEDTVPSLSAATSLLSPVPATVRSNSRLLSPRNVTFLRNDLLDEANVLTEPSPAATGLLQALLISALLLSRLSGSSSSSSSSNGHGSGNEIGDGAGATWSVRRVGELALLGNEREQRAEVAKAIHWVATKGPKGEDRYWIKARNEILWLRDWGADEEEGASSAATGCGVFGKVGKEVIEVDFLKALLANTRYSLARSLYEDAADKPLPKQMVQDAVIAAALSAYDSASNPNRTRGGLKKCDDIIHAFPRTMDGSSAALRRLEQLLAATHGLSGYRLVLQQGEPFTPVVLRVHADPLSIIGKVLEQNAKSYTRIQQLLGVASQMVAAGLTDKRRHGNSRNSSSSSRSSGRDDVAAGGEPSEETVAAQQTAAERRVTAMCIDAALNEGDFETAYSYVTSRVATMAADGAADGAATADSWLWRASLAVGKQRRAEGAGGPTATGMGGGLYSSANAGIRHMEQRMECLATALRIAPADTLAEILSAYRRCEEELEAAVQAEAEQDSAWDDSADQSWQNARPGTAAAASMPGGFEAAAALPSRSSSSASRPLASRAAAAAAAAAYAGSGSSSRRKQQSASSGAASGGADESPLSLFDLSRATARAAQRNLTALSSLRQTRLTGWGGGGGDGNEGPTEVDMADQSRHADSAHVRKRDQLRDAAMGTLTSGVGWLIGAQPVDRRREGE